MQQKTVKILSIALFASLLVWGIYTVLVYMGVPVHGLVLLAGETNDRLAASCTDNAFLCRGVLGFFGLFTRTIVRAGAFLPYLIVSILSYGAFLGWHMFRKGRILTELTLRPWHVLLAFIGSILVLLFCIGLDNAGGVFPFRRITEPLPQVYQSDK